ncbi:MAG: glucoamylase family protein, partial [Steroidobacteraceae bacterium]
MHPLISPETAAQAAATLSDTELLELVQRQTFRFFWDGAHPVSALAADRHTGREHTPDGPVSNDKMAIGGSGFGIMALIVAIERGWVSREAALERLERMLDLLGSATRFHGAFPHFVNGSTGATIAFSAKDDGADLVETSYLCMGLLCARQYFDRDTEQRARARISALWEEVEWSWYTRDGQRVLYWHWSATHGWALNHPIRGWNECLITYVLAAAAPRHPIDALVYHDGFAAGPVYRNGNSYYGVELPLGVPYGGPLFFAHYSFCGLDPRGLIDRHADYWQQNQRHVRINHAHCSANPHGYRGYSGSCWGLTASDDPSGYVAHAPDVDNGTISPTAALSSFPYAPHEALQALRHFLSLQDGRLWGRYGLVDAFCEAQD